MKLAYCLIFLCLLTGCDKNRSIPAIPDNKPAFPKITFTEPESGMTISLISETECEIANGEYIRLSEYSRQGDKLRVVNRSGGAATVSYLELLPDGLRVDEKVFLLPEPLTKSRIATHSSKNAEIYVARLIGDLAGYELANGFPPSTQQGLAALVTKPTVSPIPRKWSQQEKKLERDPWGMEYKYECPGKHNKKGFDVYSSGPDRTPGTADDIGNWTN